MVDRAKDIAEEANQEREAQEMTVKTAKEKMKAAETAEKKAAATEKNRALAMKQMSSWLRRLA